MAKESERPTAGDKGKGKVADSRELNGEKKHARNEKTVLNGKKDEEPREGR
jgi:26S proteasome regulatory subunit N1